MTAGNNQRHRLKSLNDLFDIGFRDYLRMLCRRKVSLLQQTGLSRAFAKRRDNAIQF